MVQSDRDNSGRNTSTAAKSDRRKDNGQVVQVLDWGGTGQPVDRVDACEHDHERHQGPRARLSWTLEERQEGCVTGTGQTHRWSDGVLQYDPRHEPCKRLVERGSRSSLNPA